MSCLEDCSNCSRPHKISGLKWCYDKRYKLPSLVEGPETKSRKRVISIDSVVGLDSLNVSPVGGRND